MSSARKKWGAFDFGWFLEFTKKGTAHFHIFIGSGGKLGDHLKQANRETVGKGKNEREVFRCEFERDVISWWRKLTSDGSEQWERFQNGGILEPTRHPDAAGRYAAKEAGKRVQKIAPWPVGQWWYLSPNIRPVKRRARTVTVKNYLRLFDDGKMISTLYDKRLLKNEGFKV